MSKSMGYEAILVRLGGFGRYQIFTYSWYLLVTYTLAMNVTFMYFGAIIPKELCFNTSASSGPDRRYFHNYRMISDNVSASNASCSLFYKFKSISVEWELYGSKEYIIATISSLQMVGCACGSLVSGHLSDHWGRKPVFAAGYVGLVASRLLSGFMPEWKSYTALTFINGFAFSTIAGPYLILLIEVLTPRWRMVTYFFAWPVGYILLGLCGYVFDDFRSLTFAVCFPAPVVFAMSFWIYESPKWLIQASSYTRASAVLRNIGRRNGLSLSASKSIVDELLIHEPKSTTKKHLTYWNLFYNGTSTVRFLTIFLCFFVIGTVFLGLVLDAGNLTENPAISLIVLNVVRAFVGAALPAVDQLFVNFGRRKMLNTGNILVFVCLSLQALIHISPVVEKYPHWLIFGSNLTGQIFCIFIWAALDMFAMELFPTELKNMGYNICTISVNIGAAIAPQINLSKVLWRPLPYLIYPALMIPCIVLDWIVLPETKGCALPDLTNHVPSSEKTDQVTDGSEKEIMLNEL